LLAAWSLRMLRENPTLRPRAEYKVHGTDRIGSWILEANLLLAKEIALEGQSKQGTACAFSPAVAYFRTLPPMRAGRE